MNLIEAIRDKRVFGALPVFKHPATWTNWLIALKGIFALPMTAFKRLSPNSQR